jgi:hypothetical protein
MCVNAQLIIHIFFKKIGGYHMKIYAYASYK